MGFSPGWSDSLTLKQESCDQPEQKGTRKLRQKVCQLSSIRTVALGLSQFLKEMVPGGGINILVHSMFVLN